MTNLLIEHINKIIKEGKYTSEIIIHARTTPVQVFENNISIMMCDDKGNSIGFGQNFRFTSQLYTALAEVQEVLRFNDYEIVDESQQEYIPLQGPETYIEVQKDYKFMKK